MNLIQILNCKEHVRRHPRDELRMNNNPRKELWMNKGVFFIAMETCGSLQNRKKTRKQYEVSSGACCN